MSIRNIMVAFNGAASAVSALNYAARMVGDQAHVTAVLAHSTHEVVNSRAPWVPAKAREIIEQANADILREIEARFETAKGALGLGDRLHFRREAGRVDAVLAEYARGFDLLVIGQDQSESVDEHVTIHPDRIALMSGRPVLIVPNGHERGGCRTHAIMTWEGTRASARALSDGLDLLEAQGKVTVLTMGETELARPVDEVLEHLRRHGIDASHEEIAASPGPARALLAYCKEKDPCLLVMGAHEHSKFREDFLGGVTTRVLRNTMVPVLLSH